MARKEFQLFPFRDRNLPQTVKLPIEEPDTEFKRKYPPDTELGQELADNARVWKVYRDEAIQHDDGLLAGWNNTIDILLTFAGLFSAAVTAFVVESYQFLQPATVDLGSALYALAINDTAMLRTLATSSASPSSTARWINGLWFTSLFFALAAAFLCILVKQWLDEYTARTRASSQNPKHWARRRAFYFRAIDDWGVAGIISLLPLLLHAALFLFFAGTVVLLWSLNRAMAAWLSGLGCLLLFLYVVSLLIPVWNAACPFGTPLAKQLRRAWDLSLIWLLRHGITASEFAAAQISRWRYFCHLEPDIEAACPNPRSIRLWFTGKTLTDTVEKTAFDRLLHLESRPRPDDDVEDVIQATFSDELDSEALCWLTMSVSDSDANAVGFQALGALEPRGALTMRVTDRGIWSRTAEHERLLASSGNGGSTEAMRVLRSLLVFDPTEPSSVVGGEYIRDGLRTEAWQYLRLDVSYPDMQLLTHALFVPLSATRAFGHPGYNAIVTQANGWRFSESPSMHSTAILLATLQVAKRHHILLFLLCCSLHRITPAQWEVFMPKVWGNEGPCPLHPHVTNCRLKCLPELLSRLLTTFDADDLDEVVLKRLFDAVGYHLTASLAHMPSFLSYISSDKFLHHHDAWTLSTVAEYLDAPSACRHSDCVDLRWFTIWRGVAHTLEQRSHLFPVPTPSRLVASALWHPADRHIYTATETWGSARHQFRVLLPSRDVVRALVDRVETQTVPSLWELIAGQGSPANWDFLDLAEHISATLCTISRTEDILNLLDVFFSPMTLTSLMGVLYAVEHTTQDMGPYRVLRKAVIPFCGHIMELAPSWWIEGMNQLVQDDGCLPYQLPWGHVIKVESLQDYALDLTSRTLRRGPCYDCPVSVAPLAFDASLRDYTANPFAIYPIVDVDIDTHE